MQIGFNSSEDAMIPNIEENTMNNINNINPTCYDYLSSKAVTNPTQSPRSPINTSNKSTVVQIFDIEDEVGIEIDPYFRIIKNLDGFSQLNMNNSLYLCGANMNNDSAGSHLLQFDPNKNTANTTILISSINHHYYPTLLAYKNEFIIAVGGLKNKSAEIYNLKMKKWKNLPELPEERYRCTAVADELTDFVYILGGFNSEIEKNASTLLRLNMKHSLIWETLVVKNNSNLLSRNSSAVIKFDRSSVFILGGRNNENELTETIVEFDLHSRQVSLSRNTLSSPATFSQQTGSDLNKSDFFLFDENGNILKITRNDFAISKINFKQLLEDNYDN